MRPGATSGFALTACFRARAPACRVSFAIRASPRRQRSPVSLRSTQQSSSHHEQIGKASRDLQPVQVLGQPSVADLLEPEHPLDHPDAVLNLRAHTGLATVYCADALIDPAAPAVALVGEVFGSARHFADGSLLAAIGLVTPHARL